MNLELAANRKSNNLNLMKFVAAVLVVFSHAYAVTGSGEDPLFRFSRNQITFGGLAVTVFFFASGFYVTKSLLRRGNRAYWKSRFGKIYPSLTVVIVCTAFIMGPIVSTKTLAAYFSSPETYRYLEYLLMIPRYSLPGVFRENPSSVVNGSLWTIILEMICYLGLFIAYQIHLLDKKKMKLLNVVFVAGVLIAFGMKPKSIFAYHSYLRPLCLFIAGMDYYIFREEIKLDWKVGTGVLIGGILLCLLHCLDLAMIFAFPYLLSLIIFSSHQIDARIGDLGKYSYGMYLTAFPIQQCVVRSFPNAGILMNTVCSSLVSFLLAILLFYIIEKPVAQSLR